VLCDHPCAPRAPAASAPSVRSPPPARDPATTRVLFAPYRPAELSLSGGRVSRPTAPGAPAPRNPSSGRGGRGAFHPGGAPRRRATRPVAGGPQTSSHRCREESPDFLGRRIPDTGAQREGFRFRPTPGTGFGPSKKWRPASLVRHALGYRHGPGTRGPGRTLPIALGAASPVAHLPNITSACSTPGRCVLRESD